MSITLIKQDDSLDTIWSVLTYEESRLTNDEDASDLAPAAVSLVERWAIISSGQRGAWRNAITAQGKVDAKASALKAVINRLDDELMRISRDRDSPRRKRYFKKARHELVCLGLESALDAVRAWPASLKTEPEPSLQALGARLAECIAAGDAAVLERSIAAASTGDHRVREIMRFVDECNAVRRTRLGLLIQRAQERGLPADWPDQFFKKTSQGRKVKAPEPPVLQTAEKAVDSVQAPATVTVTAPESGRMALA